MQEIRENTSPVGNYEPTDKLVFATVTDIQRDLDIFGAKNPKSELFALQQDLRKTLRGDFMQIYFMGGATITQLMLKPYARGALGYGIDGPVKRFVADLEYVALLKQGGLNRVNGRMAELLASIQGNTPIEERIKE